MKDHAVDFPAIKSVPDKLMTFVLFGFFFVSMAFVHYFSIDETNTSILYAELEKSTKMYEKDIDWKPRIRTSVGYLYGHKSGNRLKISFDSNDFGAAHLIKNKNILIAHFLKGVNQFDSGLSISDSVFSEFHIDKDTFLYNRKGHLKFAITCMVAFVLIALAIYYFIRIAE